MNELEQQKARFDREDDQRLTDAFRMILSDVNGRRFLWWLLEQCGYGNDPAMTGDPYCTFHAAGKNAVALQLIAEMSTRDPQGYIALQVEIYNERSSRDELLRTIADRLVHSAAGSAWVDPSPAAD